MKRSSYPVTLKVKVDNFQTAREILISFKNANLNLEIER